MSSKRHFTARATRDGDGVFVPVPFDPDGAWGRKRRHHVTGTVGGRPLRAVVEFRDGRHGFRLGPAWQRDCALPIGEDVEVSLAPEGPQRADLAEDVAAALDASPAAAEHFDSLAQFYRRRYLRWIDATKRRPEVRAQRIAEMVSLLEAGVKDYRRAP